MLGVALHAPDGRGEAIVEEDTVGQAGQMVVEGVVNEASLHGLLPGDLDL